MMIVDEGEAQVNYERIEIEQWIASKVVNHISMPV